MPQALGSAPLSISIELDGHQPSVALSGKADYSNITRIVSALDQLMEEHERCVSLDMQAVEALVASALEGLARSVGAFTNRRRKLHLKKTSIAVRDTLDRHHLSDLFCCRHDCCKGCSPDTCGAKFNGLQADVFTFASEIGNCREARERVGRLAESAGFSNGVVSDIMLAVGEAVVNAVKYCQESPSFTVSCLAASDKFCVSVSDSGPGFDLENIPSFEDALFMEHGRGIHCMNALMDEVSFHFDAGTTVRMVKRTR